MTYKIEFPECIPICEVRVSLSILFYFAIFARWGYQASEDRVGPGWLCDGGGGGSSLLSSN